MNLPNQPFAMAGIDAIVSESHQTFHKKTYILVANCYLTRYCVTSACFSQNAESVIDFIEQKIIPYFGFIRILVQDRFKAFTGTVLCDKCKEWGTEQRFTSGYHPQTNSFVERTNYSIKELLSAYVGTNARDWDRNLALATYAINASINETTGRAPMYSVLSRVPINHFCNKLKAAEVNDLDNEVESISVRMERVREICRERLLANARQRMVADQKKRQRPLLIVGDLALRGDPPPVYGKFPSNYKP